MKEMEPEREGTKHRRPATVLPARNKYLKTILDNTTSPIYLKDTGNRYLFVNRQYERLAHISEKEIVGKTDFDVFPEPVATLFRAQDEEVIKCGIPMEFEETIDLPDGKYTFITSKFPLFDDDGTCYAVGGFCTDITLRKKAEHQLKEAEKKLIHADKMAALGQIVAGVSHEIGNSISFISGALPSLKRSLDILKDNLPAEKAAQEGETSTAGNLEQLWQNIELLIKNIHEGTRRTAKTIQDLRVFSHYHKNDTPALVEAHDILDSTLSLLFHEFKERGIAIITDYRAAQSGVFCHSNRLSQAFVNILLNSAQAIGQKGTIAISTWNDSQNVVIKIKDDGCGMTRDLQERIFDPFFTTKDVGEGTGLGLSITHEIIQNINGKIDLSSKIGQGTEFLLTLPLVTH